MIHSDESFKTCECKSEIVVDLVAKKISCSECGRVFYSTEKAFSFDELSLQNPQTLGSNPASTDPNPGGSFYDFLPFTFENPQNHRSDSGTTNPNTGGYRFPVSHPIIAAMLNRLLLPENVKVKTDQIFNKVVDTSKRPNWNDALYAACIYIACRLEKNTTRSISEICSAANGVTPSNMLIAIGSEADELKIDKTSLTNLKTTDFINWFGSALEMNSLAIKAAQEAANSSECVNSPRSVISVAAVVVYVISLFTDDKKKSLIDIVEVTGVEEKMIRETYDELYTHLKKIAPKCFANAMEQEEIDRFIDSL